MAYLVKYISNAFGNVSDISDLYKRDIKNGYKVILVCENQHRNFIEKSAVEVVNSDDVKKSESDLMVLYDDKDGMIKAVECANIINASECQIYIDTDGIYSADPSYTDFAHRLDRIDFNEVLEICACGYKAINSSVVELARKYGVVLHILSYKDENSKGTIVKEVMGISGLTVKGIIKESDISIVSLKGVPDVKGICYNIFRIVSEENIVVDIISLPTAYEGRGEISFTVNREDKKRCEEILEQNRDSLGFTDLFIDDNVTKVSVIGAALQTTKGIAAKVFEILYKNDINLKLINTSEIKISVLIDKNMSDIAVQKIHEAFID